MTILDRLKGLVEARDKDEDNRKKKGVPDDVVARRLVMRRDRWELCVKLADELRADKIEVSPMDVAALLLDVGIMWINRGEKL